MTCRRAADRTARSKCDTFCPATPTVWFSCRAALVKRNLMPSAHAPSSAPVWFITGCSTGFGRELALAVLDKGWRAVVTARQPSSLAEFDKRYGDRALVIELDVTQVSQIKHAVEKTLQQFGRIDVLVN